MQKSKVLRAAVLAGAFSSSAALATPTLTTLVNFTGSAGNAPGGGPTNLIIDKSGNLYGATSSGGVNGYGNLFKLATGTHTYSTLASFNFDGATPSPFSPGQSYTKNLALDSTGTLYGVSQYSFLYNNDSTGNGSAFKVVAGSNTLTTMSTFDNTAAGFNPTSLTIDSAGNLFGTAANGGPAFVAGGGGNYGTVFKIAAGTNTPALLAGFNGSNGLQPSGVINDSAGNLYGIAQTNSGNGEIFKIASGTATIIPLATFNGSNGATPDNLVLDTHGNLFGTTEYGAAGSGTAFEIPAGTATLTTLATFAGASGTGPDPGGLLVDTAGNLFGIAGPSSSVQSLFKVSAATDVLSTVYSFNSNIIVEGDLAADSAGNLYGTAVQGGTGNNGTAFELTGTGFAVPEPTSLSLLVIATPMLLRRQRRRPE
jgi:uncharacterized repeat protein (TIGR03803 family)